MKNNKDIEIEIKIKLNKDEFDYQKNQFDKIGEFIKEEIQKDSYFTPKDNDFTKQEHPYEWLSIRERNENKILNYKHYYPEGAAKHDYCDELEVNVDDVEKMTKIFKAMNVNCFGVVNKKRLIYMYEDKYEIALDNVENIGYFVEIEVKKIEEDYLVERDKLYDLAKKFNMNLDNIQFKGYPHYLLDNLKDRN